MNVVASSLTSFQQNGFIFSVDAIVAADSSGGILGELTFILVMAFVALAVLVTVIGILVLYRRRNLKLKNLSTPVDLEKLQNNPIFDQRTNYYVNPQLLSWEVPRNTMEFIKELGQGNGKWTLKLNICYSSILPLYSLVSSFVLV